MSRTTVRQPIIHTPSFKEFTIDRLKLKRRIRALGLAIPMDMLDSLYYYTDLDGWAKILPDLCFKSDLYKPDKFDCDNYALKAQTICAERYGLNTLGTVIGSVPRGRHAFNMLYFGEGFMFFEPNLGFVIDGAFEIGEHGYIPDSILI